MDNVENKEGMSVENDSVTKTKVTLAEIIVGGTIEKPYFHIRYHEVGKGYNNVGFGSYILENVFRWRDEYLEVVKENNNIHVEVQNENI